jgi:uncharacterized protein YbbC (DUF1343 family)
MVQRQNMPTGRVRTGLESLAAAGFAPLKGAKVGLVTNPTGILPDLSSTIEALAQAPDVNLRALFGPEHGVRGDVPAGKYIASSKDPATGVPVYSLYGETKVPTAGMLRGLDVLVFDIQDIGARSYTYLSTLGCVMEGAARNGVSVMVLDRPNPVGLNRVEGGPTRSGFFSFVSKYPVPYLHGMTLGELAQMINRQGWLSGGVTCNLTVIPCANLTRSQATWESFGGLPWVPTSPHVPGPRSPHYYGITGIVGELSTISIGVGYPLPFELSGAPGIGPASLMRELTRRALPGFAYRPMTWTPYYAAYKGKNCGGVQIYLSDPARAPLSRFNFEIMDALRTLDKGRAFFTESESTRMFDLGCGTDKVRKAFQSGANARDMWAIFNEGRDAFIERRKPYLLYE